MVCWKILKNMRLEVCYFTHVSKYILIIRIINTHTHKTYSFLCIFYFVEFWQYQYTGSPYDKNVVAGDRSPESTPRMVSLEGSNTKDRKSMKDVMVEIRKATVAKFEEGDKRVLKVTTRMSVIGTLTMVCFVISILSTSLIGFKRVESTCQMINTAINSSAMAVACIGSYLTFSSSKEDYDRCCSPCDQNCQQISAYCVTLDH